jgi:hypothetical protein
MAGKWLDTNPCFSGALTEIFSLFTTTPFSVNPHTLSNGPAASCKMHEGWQYLWAAPGTLGVSIATVPGRPRTRLLVRTLNRPTFVAWDSHIAGGRQRADLKCGCGHILVKRVFVSISICIDLTGIYGLVGRQ